MRHSPKSLPNLQKKKKKLQIVSIHILKLLKTAYKRLSGRRRSTLLNLKTSQNFQKKNSNYVSHLFPLFVVFFAHLLAAHHQSPQPFQGKSLKVCHRCVQEFLLHNKQPLSQQQHNPRNDQIPVARRKHQAPNANNTKNRHHQYLQQQHKPTPTPPPASWPPIPTPALQRHRHEHSRHHQHQRQRHTTAIIANTTPLTPTPQPSPQNSRQAPHVTFWRSLFQLDSRAIIRTVTAP